MDGFAAVDFGFAREVLQRGIAALYLVAFLSTLNQFRPLLGERGLLPAPELLAWATSSSARRRMLRPTLFTRIRYTDRRLAALCWAGMIVAGTVVIGIPQLAPPWVPMICFLLLWGGYMSITSIGQTFYSFGWEMLLLMYHHETQPMPGPLSRQAHLLPKWFHRGEVLGNHFAQLVVPFFLFAPLATLFTPTTVDAILLLIGAIAATIVILTQLWLVLTGNFAWLNAATIVLAFSAFPTFWSSVDVPNPEPLRAPNGIPLYWVILTSAVGMLVIALSWPALRNLFACRQLMNASFSRWQLGNAYGAFGTVTKQRIEYIVEGTTDADPDAAEWREYEFKGKPGALRRIPRQFAPYHLRLDWLMWFLPLGRSLEDWFMMFLVRLLEADRPTLRMLHRDPFDGERPTWVRVVSYRYRFATRAEHRGSGDVWVRDRRHVLVRPLGLGD
ncbi:lipase maturation factor family protein [Microbacterium sp. Re1]|uniref:Lipase maturation factor family protein n=1 Tax=Microbacterium commune TaxID=2762219 RepID=A0ABR8W3U8_9MICO|nr:lipase maturation factor family protein [Microbacterium commune]MBD8011697.1 lipase maturation factor family protein [Microbacterium commune]